jgi:hypothetical protein
MTSFSEVLELAKTASDALNALEDASRGRVLSIFSKFENGLITDAQLSTELSNQARVGFVTAASVANEHVKSLAADSGVHGLNPSTISTAPVLDRILTDISKNLDTYQDSDRSDTDLRRLRFRTILSVQAAARKGFTESQLAVAGVLRDQGATLRKVWMANFVNNTPCDTCKALHGTEVSLGAEFPHGGVKAPKTFCGLQGPPRHPNCRCYMLVYLVTLDTAAVIPEVPTLDEHKFMTSKDVRRLPRAVYTAAVTTLRLIAGKLKGALRDRKKR